MLEKYLATDQTEFTYKQYSMLLLFILLGTIISVLGTFTVIFHSVAYFLVKRREKALANRPEIQVDNDSDIIMEQDSDSDNTIANYKYNLEMNELRSLAYADYNTLEVGRTRDSVNSSHDKTQSKKKYVQKHPTKSQEMIAFMICALETATYTCILTVIDIFVSFGYISTTTFFIMLKYIIWIAFITGMYMRYMCIFRNYHKIMQKFRNYSGLIFGAVAVPLLMYCSGTTFLASGVCMASHNQALDGFEYAIFKVSTSYMRSVYDSTCPASTVPCMTYLTLPEDSVHGMFVNFHINLDSCEDQVCLPYFKYALYDEMDGEKTWKHVKPVKSIFESLPSEYEKRNIFTVYLPKLEENTQYAFTISLKKLDSGSQVYYFKTLDPHNMKIINGGDIGINPEARAMHKALKDMNADLIMVGGDISYDNNFPECYRATDQIIHEMPHSSTNGDMIKLIPMIKAPGNHDYGVNSVNNANIVHNQHEPLYKHYYPQHTFAGQVPDLSQRRGYFYHLIGNRTLLISLDSGYESSIDGEQTVWLESLLSNHSEVPIKIVHYHEPIYPSCGYDQTKFTELAKKFWVPLFDSYNVTVAFENHAHRLKRTYPLRNNQKADQGTLYIGDGAWGAIGDECDLINTDIIAKDQIINHVWIFDITDNNELEIQAIGADQEVIDSVHIQI